MGPLSYGEWNCFIVYSSGAVSVLSGKKFRTSRISQGRGKVTPLVVLDWVCCCRYLWVIVRFIPLIKYYFLMSFFENWPPWWMVSCRENQYVKLHQSHYAVSFSSMCIWICCYTCLYIAMLLSRVLVSVTFVLS